MRDERVRDERGGWRGACVTGCCNYLAPSEPLRDTRVAEGGSARDDKLGRRRRTAMPRTVMQMAARSV